MFSYGFALLSAFAVTLAIQLAAPDSASAAGNVLAFAGPDISGDNTILVIEGDNEANEIRVTEVIPGHALVEGLNGTTVNGKPSEEVTAEVGEFTLAEIHLGNGGDSLIYDSSDNQVPHAMIINTGNGEDSVTLRLAGNARLLTVDTEGGNDHVTVEVTSLLFLSAAMRINTGHGDDDVLFRGPPMGGVALFFTTAEILTEQGDDVVAFEGEFDAFFDGFWVNLAEGNDFLVGDSEGELPGFATVVANGGSGFDAVLNSEYFFGHSFLHLFEFFDGE